MKNSTNNGKMTKADRESLLRVARMRERVTKSGLAEVGSRLLVDLDKQLDAYYSFDSDEIWKESLKIATKATKEAQTKVSARCRELGIPDRFAPSIQTRWISSGEQAVKERRAELRQMARKQVETLIKTGKRKIEEVSLNVQTRILASGLSEEAKAFLETIPSPEQLMPRLSLGELEKMLGRGSGYYQSHLSEGNVDD